MGSLSGVGIPVVSKNNYTFRKQDILITRTDSVDDTESTYVSYRPELHRTISSGSIVRDTSTGVSGVEYHEDVVWGVNFGSRSTSARIARDGSRDLNVDDKEIIVIPTGLGPHTPQEWDYQTGDKVVRRQSVDDSLVDRVANTGVYG